MNPHPREQEPQISNNGQKGIRNLISNIADLALEPSTRATTAKGLEPAYSDTGALAIRVVFDTAGIPSISSELVNIKEPSSLNRKVPSTSSNSAFDGFRLPQDLPRSWKRHFETNVESDPEYPGWAPASVSLVAFSHEYAFSRRVQEGLKPRVQSV
ncbi:hypothetical protein BJX66DRAFT_340443 [Aspergillus keveii]|uniref:Uncharacterized protein n=1 Tax=Aspergillus keveii TaxID=714993 RepID=A0ABR4FYF1_9EURO